MKIRLLMIACLLAGCSLVDEPTDEPTPDVKQTEPDTDTDTDTDTEPDPDTDPDTDTDTEPDPDTDPDPDATECPTGVPMGDYFGKILIPVVVDGTEYQFVYDTGAPTSVVDVNTAEEIGDGPHRLQIAGKQIDVDSLYAYDLSSIGDIDGLLGNDVVGDFVISMDYGRRQFWLSDDWDDVTLEACDHLAGAPTTIDFLYDEYVFVPGAFESLEGWLLIDSGASLGVVTKPVFDQLQQRRERVAIPGFYTPAAIGTFWAELTTIGGVSVGDLTVENIVSRTIPDSMIEAPEFPDGGTFLGVAPSGFLRHHVVTVDFGSQRIRLDRLAGSSGREPSDFFPFGVGLAEDPDVATVSYLVPGGSAQTEGIQLGDVVVSLDGTELSGMDPSRRAWTLVAQVAGVTAQVIVERDGERLEFELTSEDVLDFGP